MLMKNDFTSGCDTAVSDVDGNVRRTFPCFWYTDTHITAYSGTVAENLPVGVASFFERCPPSQRELQESYRFDPSWCQCRCEECR